MNIFKKAYCRIYQGVFRLMLPILPYREPKILKTDEEVVSVLKEKGIRTLLKQWAPGHMHTHTRTHTLSSK